jgi:hypothetical protein
VHLNPDDVIVCEIHIDQGMKAQNPMLNVRFYQTADPEGGDEPFTMPQEQVTSMLGTVYQGVQQVDVVCLLWARVFEDVRTGVLLDSRPGRRV